MILSQFTIMRYLVNSGIFFLFFGITCSCSRGYFKTRDTYQQRKYLERRVPTYNKQILSKNVNEKSLANTNKGVVYGDKKSQNQYHNGIKKNLTVINSDKNPGGVEKIKEKDTALISINDINFNESKNREKLDKIILDSQNLQKKDDKISSEEKYKLNIKPIQDGDKVKKKDAELIIEPEPPIQPEKLATNEDKSTENDSGIFYVVISDIESINEATEKVQHLRRITGKSMVISHNKNTDTYSLKIGPMMLKNEAISTLKSVKNNGYSEAMVMNDRL